ncbi:unnamed protein product [Pedinophyceae sp. YPF-701]|nr:unnamed protein product [Pedinophyceae sp. YPF-701]
MVAETMRRSLQSDGVQQLSFEGQLVFDINTFWLVFGSMIVFYMQAGFALLEAGTVRVKNVKNILVKNLMDACLSALVWWAIGHPLASGPNPYLDPTPLSGVGRAFGATNFFIEDTAVAALQDPASGSFYASWLFSWSFAATSSTIVSGAVAERCRFNAYILYTVLMTGVIYPVGAFWHAQGWFNDGIRDGYSFIDFAGSGTVHMVGGVAALVGSYFLGPRSGRFKVDGTVVPFVASSSMLQALGVLILWFAWYGFNCVSTGALVGLGGVAAYVAVNTTLSAAAGGVFSLIIAIMGGNDAELPPLLNGVLSGLVAVTASAHAVKTWAAFVIGLAAGGIYHLGVWALLRLRIDDPLDAVPVHGFCGLWGVIAAGLFSTHTPGNNTVKGAFYGDGAQLGVQIAGALALLAWVAVCCILLFGFLRKVNLLRVPYEEEVAGLDMKHGGQAFRQVASKQHVA